MTEKILRENYVFQTLTSISSVVDLSFFPCYFLLLIFHVEMCLNRQWNISDQRVEWILIDPAKILQKDVYSLQYELIILNI